MTAADNMKRLEAMSRAAASLELHSETVIDNSDPDAVAISLEAVASLRNTISNCKGLQANEPLASTVQRIITFVADAFAEGLPEATDDSEALWQLMATSIACGFELVELGSPEVKASPDIWSTPLRMLAATLDVLKAQL
jgi:hypothetical protein